MRFSPPHRLGPAVLLAASLLLQGASAATLTLPTLYQCEAAVLNIEATGNFTVEARNNATGKLVFRQKLDAGTTSVTWDSVDLQAKTVALFELTDQIGTRRSQTSVSLQTATVQDSPNGNSTCLSGSSKESTNSTKSPVATIIGICVGVFVLLMCCLIGWMVYRRKKERKQRFDNDSVDDSHNGDFALPGGGYMAKLVPGLNLQAARPLARDIELETEQAKYADTRRMTRHYSRPAEAVAGRPTQELPTYGQSQRLSKFDSRYQHAPASHQPRRQNNDGYTYQTDVSLGQADTDTSNPFVSRYEQENSVYSNKHHQGWDRSQTNFLPPRH